MGKSPGIDGLTGEYYKEYLLNGQSASNNRSKSAALAIVLSAVKFEQFIKKFKKTYADKKELYYRQKIFLKNLKEADRLQKEDQGSAKYGMTKFSDLTDEEFRRYYLNSVTPTTTNTLREVKVEASPQHPTCDWRKAGVISEVKHQEKCGACWAFASVGNIEALWGIHNRPRNLSVQQILDCGPCDAGCKGGYAWDAFLTVQKQRRLVDETEYPYVGIRKGCDSKRFRKVGHLDGFVMLPKDEDAMASYVSANGTLTVCINGTLLKHYTRDVIRALPRNCNHTIDHMVLLVGYSKGNNEPYWIAKNSWGTDWGENGYFRIYRGDNICGIATYPVSAIVDFSGGEKKTCPK
ncbi:cathepsin W-like [Gastrophryne carolinensis]